MFIQYNDTNVHAIPKLTYKTVTLRNKKTGKKRTVNRLDTNQSPQDIQWLRPGWNEFPKEVWLQHKDSPSIQKMLRKKKIVLMEEKVTFTKGGKKFTKVVGPEDERVHIRWFNEKRAIEIVRDTYDRDMLQRWLDKETRSKVKRRIEAQIEPLLASSQDDDGDDDDSDNDD